MRFNVFGYTFEAHFYKTPTIEQLVVEKWVKEGRLAAVKFYRSTAPISAPMSLKDALEYIRVLGEKHPLLRYVKG